MLLEVLIPVLLVVGTLGNLLSAYVFTRPSIRGLSTFKFLAYLSVIDCLYLLIGLPHIIVLVFADYNFRNHSNVVCSLHSFLTIYLSHLSSNILAAVGVFRCVTITTLRPVKSNLMRSTNAAAASIAQTIVLDEKQRRQMNSNNNNNVKSEKLHIVYSNNARSSSLIRRLMPRWDQVDVIVFAIMLVVFFFDFHFLIFMRLNLETTTTTNGTNETLATALTCYPSSIQSGAYYSFYTYVHPWMGTKIFFLRKKIF
jgi:hypothetical protein